MVLHELRLDLLENNYGVERLDVQTMVSKTCTKSSIDQGLVYSDYQDGDDGSSTTASFRSEHSFYSDFSQRSDPPSPCKSSSIPSTDGALESKAQHEEDDSLAIDWSPSRLPRHRRTRSGNWNNDVLVAAPIQVPSEETCAESLPSVAGKSGQCSMQAAYFSFYTAVKGASFPTLPNSLRRPSKDVTLPPLAEMEPIEEAEDEDEVPEEPVPMVPTGTSFTRTSFTASTCTDGYWYDSMRSLFKEGKLLVEEGAL